MTNVTCPMSDRELNQFIDHVKFQTGIKLDASKRYLLESRLSPVLEKFDLGSYSELLDCVVNTRSQENEAVISAITTNETYFFRDKHPFDLLKYELIPDLLRKNHNGVIKIASAACSSGQEAYSIAMVLKEMCFDFKSCRAEISAFDISSDVIAMATKGRYSKFEVKRGLSEEKIKHYFDYIDGRYQVKSDLKSLVSFSKRNLLALERPVEKFNIIFCRNVVNYFEDKTRLLLFDNLAEMLLPNGALVIGATEFLDNSGGHFVKKNEKGSVYYVKLA